VVYMIEQSNCLSYVLKVEHSGLAGLGVSFGLFYAYIESGYPLRVE